MPCSGPNSPCAQRRARQEAERTMEYEWTSSDGSNKVVYPKESIARAKVMRVGGSYAPKAKT